MNFFVPSRKLQPLTGNRLSFESLELRRLLAGLDGSEAVGLPEDMISTAYVFIGDHSSSNTEIWNMTVGDRTHSAPSFGVVQRDRRDFKKGETYPVTVQHVATNREQGPDFDYRAWIDRKARPRWTSGSPRPSGSEFFVTDSSSLFQRRYFGSSFNPTLGKSALLHFPAIDLDIDSDSSGTIDRSLVEDILEADSTTGPYLPIFSEDLDNDNIPDNFDFDGIAGASFMPVTLSLSANLNYIGGPSQITLNFDFDDAGNDPSQSDGLFRLWTKDASAVRTEADLISAGTPFSASAIGLAPGAEVTLYLEAVNPTQRTVHFDPLTVSALVNGSIWQGELVDEVFARGINGRFGNLTLEGVAEEDEETLGGIVFYNDNDSDDNGILDLQEDFGRTAADPDWATLTVDPIEAQDLSGTYSLDFSGSVRIWADNGNGTFDYLSPGETFDAIDPPSLFVEGFSKDSEDEITLGFVSESGIQVPNADKVKVKTAQVVVEWAKIADQANSDIFNSASGRLEEDKAKIKSKGAFILLNDDDDDFDGEEDSKDTQLLSNQENDLLPIYVKKVKTSANQNDITYRLIKPTELRIWTAVQGGKRPFVDDDIVFGNDVEELTFYVDAKEASASARRVTLKVTHNPTGKTFNQPIYVNIFKIRGPQNVPDFPIYEYNVDGSIASRAGTVWVNPRFGETRDQDTLPADENDAVRLFWNISPTIAKARYQATADFVWARDINVVYQCCQDNFGGWHPG